MKPSKKDPIFREMVRHIASVPKPYDDGAFAKLTQEQQGKVILAEMDANVSVSNALGYTRGIITHEWADEMKREFGLDCTIDDKVLIDEPLAGLRKLAATYAETGLAADEAAARKMADAYKDSAVQHNLSRDNANKRSR